VLDFYCPVARLAIEIDGIAHDMADRAARDARRDDWLKAHDIMVVRIPVSELPREIDDVADAIVRMAQERL
jgi:very-short-patch-repair endonuclease